MKLTLLTLCVATFALSLAHSGYAADPLAVRLMSDKNGYCGSGFYLEADTVVTNLHVVESLCPQGDCSGLTKSIGPAQIGSRFPALDIATLKVAPREHFANPALSTAERDLAVRILGFPGCKELETRKGGVSAVRPLDLTLTANAEYGMSGSPVVDQSGKIVGVLRRADTLGGAMVGAAFGGGFPARVIRADVLERVLKATPREQCGIQASVLTQQWLRVLDRVTGFDRGLELLGLREAAIGLTDCVHVDPSLAKDLLLFLRRPHEYPALGFGASSDQLVWELQKVALASSLTAFGSAPVGAPPELWDLEAVLTKQLSSERADEVKAMTALMSSRSFYGAEADLFTFMGSILLWVILFGTMWAFSGGVVFRDVSGPVVWKLLVTLAVLILLWPLSLVAYLVMRKKPSPPPISTNAAS